MTEFKNHLISKGICYFYLKGMRPDLCLDIHLTYFMSIEQRLAILERVAAITEEELFDINSEIRSVSQSSYIRYRTDFTRPQIVRKIIKLAKESIERYRKTGEIPKSIKNG
jgi:hypothetical protein